MKTIKEMIEVMQAYEDGKEIEFNDSHHGWVTITKPIWDWAHLDYRVKPASKYMPYKTTDEMVNDYIERFQNANIPFITEKICPPICLKPKNATYFYIIEAFAEHLIKINNDWCDLTDIFENYEFVDGSPVGKFV